MTKPTDLRSLAQRLGFFDPRRRYAAEVVRAERQLVKVTSKIHELTDMVGAMDARLLDSRAEMARLHYGARKAARRGSEPQALMYLSDKREAENRVRELEEEVEAGRLLLRQAKKKRDLLREGLDELRRAFQADSVVRLAEDVARNARPPAVSIRRLEGARRKLLHAETLAQLDDPDDPFDALPELVDDDDRVLLARWKAEDRAQAA